MDWSTPTLILRIRENGLSLSGITVIGNNGGADPDSRWNINDDYIGLFQAIGIHIENFYMNYIVLIGLVSAPFSQVTS